MASLPQSYGFIGLGAMGYPMATRLRRGLPPHIPLVIFDLDTRALERFSQACPGDAGEVRIASSARDVAAAAECIITIVPEGAHVKAVYLTPETGLLAADTSGKLFIDSSTIDPDTSLEVGQAVAASPPSTGGNSPPLFYDAPVSGGTAGAEKGTLAFMVGAARDDPTFPRLKEILSPMGAAINACGGPSLGLVAKLSNNYLSGLIALATAEAMNLGMRCGMDAKVLARCFATGSAANHINATVNPVPGVCPDAVTSHGYKPGFKVQLMKKDLLLAIEAARQADAKLVLADAALHAYSSASEDPRCRDKDSRVVYRWLGGREPEVKR